MTNSHQAHSPAVRDRILAYLGQMDISPVESLEIALKTLERPGAATDPGLAVETLLDLLRSGGQGQALAARTARAAELALPPLNRQSMVSEGLNISIADLLARMVAGGFRPVKNDEAGPREDRP